MFENCCKFFSVAPRVSCIFDCVRLVRSPFSTSRAVEKENGSYKMFFNGVTYYPELFLLKICLFTARNQC